MSGPMFAALGTFLTAADKAGLTSSKRYQGITLHLPPTAEELEEKLRDAQERWDTARQYYEAALVSGTEPEDYTRHTIKNWAEKEGKPLPWEMEAKVTDW